MKKRLYRLSAGLILMLIGLSTAYAALTDRSYGSYSLIYDNIQNITWMADANYAQTSGYDTDGLMTWDNATTWANQLVYGGYDDWRLFNAAPDDTGCSNNIDPGGGHPTQYYGYNCSQNELGHLFYNDLGLSADDDISNGDPAVLTLFDNVNSYYYWSDTEYAPSDYAWRFGTYNGYQDVNVKTVEGYSWAVRTGDVAAVPEPASLLLLLSGLLGIRAHVSEFKKSFK